MVKIGFVIALTGLFTFVGFHFGYRSCEKSINKRLVELRRNELTQKSMEEIDPIKSLHDDFRKISGEQQLLKRNIQITKEYLSNDDIQGLNKWVEKMESFLAK